MSRRRHKFLNYPHMHTRPHLLHWAAFEAWLAEHGVTLEWAA